MARNAKPSELEMQVLSVLWERGPLGVRQVSEALPDRKKRAYTTVLSVMQTMEKKGLLAHDRNGLAHIYRPKVSREQVFRPMMRTLLRNVFSGRAATAMQYLLAESKLDEAEVREMRALIDDHAREQQKGGRS